MTQAQSKEQLIGVTLRLIQRYGIEGTTTARVAAAAGVTEPTLYRHFGSRKGLLLAAFSVVHQAAMDNIQFSRHPDALQRLREIGENHNAHLLSHKRGFADPLWEFIAAPASLGLRDTVIAGSRLNVAALAMIVDEGKAQGTIRADIDAEQTAWRIMGFFFFEDVAYLLRAQDAVLKGLSLHSLESILEEIAAESGE
jgi:TetR/AcrR family transcriptional regulator